MNQKLKTKINPKVKKQHYLKNNILEPSQMNDTGINYLEDVVKNRAVGYERMITGEFNSLAVSSTALTVLLEVTLTAGIAKSCSFA